MRNIKIKSYCKVNLTLRVLRKLRNGYHEITSMITFCNLHDVISISKTNNRSDKITFSGKFSSDINKKSNSVSAVLSLIKKKILKKNQFFKINIKKNIPHGSGLGGGSSNAAAILNYFISKNKLKINKERIEKLANQIGSDVPVSLVMKNSYLTGKKGEIIRTSKKFRLNLLIVFPNIFCSTKRIYQKNKKISPIKKQPLPWTKNSKNLINFLKNDKNDLQETVIKIYPKVGKIIDFIQSQKGCYFSRISGSGSACIGIFSNKKNAIYAKKLIKLKYPKYWCVVSKTI